MFHNSSRTIHRVLTLIVLFALAVMTASPALAVTVGNDEINFIGVRYNYPTPGESTWYYQVTSGSRPAISHVLWELNLGCLMVTKAGTWDGVNQDSLNDGAGIPVIGLDPPTGHTGLKFDQGFQEGETRYYFFTVNGNYLQDENITVVSKGGNGFDQGLIIGPAASCAALGPKLDLEKFINEADADEAPGVSLTEGDAFNFVFTVTNTGNVPLADITITDDVLGFICSVSSLAVNGSATCNVASEAGLGLHSNLGLAYAVYQGIRVEDTDPAHYTGQPRFVPDPKIDLEKLVFDDDADEAPGPELVEGESVTFWFNVVNTGNVELTNIRIEDDVYGFICGIDSLDPMEHFRCEAYAPVGLGQHTNLGTVTADYGSTVVSDSDPANYFGVPRFIPNPAIDLEKLVNDDDADEPTGPIVLLPNTVGFSFIVRNTGNVNLSNVVINDDVLGEICSFALLSVGESKTCGVTADAAEGQHVNTGTAAGEYQGVTVTDTDPAHYLGKKPFVPKPGIDLEKYVNKFDADTSVEGPVLPVGSTVTFTYVVKNTGNVDLTNVIIADNKLGIICTIPRLVPGQIVTCTKTSKVIAGLYSNIGKAGTWYGDPKNGGVKVEAIDWGHYTGQ